MSGEDKPIAQRKKPYTKEEILSALITLLPSFLLLTVFAIIPILISFASGFLESSAYISTKLVWFRNYGKVLTDVKFWKSIWVGIRYILLIVPVQIVLAFFIAMLITKLKRGVASFVKTAIYIPCILSGIVTGAIFMYIYAYDGGMLNFILGCFGIEKQAWLGDPNLAWISVSVASIWGGLGYVTLVMLGALLDVPRDYYEAATIDGAGSLAKTIFITLPSIKNVGAYLLVTSFVSTFQLFELPFIMTGGGPLDSTLAPVGLLYHHFNWDSTLGYTMAASVVIAVVLASVSSLVFKYVSSEKSME